MRYGIIPGEWRAPVNGFRLKEMYFQLRNFTFIPLGSKGPQACQS